MMVDFGPTYFESLRVMVQNLVDNIHFQIKHKIWKLYIDKTVAKKEFYMTPYCLSIACLIVKSPRTHFNIPYPLVCFSLMPSQASISMSHYVSFYKNSSPNCPVNCLEEWISNVCWSRSCEHWSDRKCGDKEVCNQEDLMNDQKFQKIFDQGVDENWVPMKILFVIWVHNMRKWNEGQEKSLRF